jgi:hypothetical protein
MGMQKREVRPLDFTNTGAYKSVLNDVNNNSLLTAEDKASLLTELTKIGKPGQNVPDNFQNQAAAAAAFESGITAFKEKSLGSILTTRTGQKAEADQLYKTILENPNQKIATKNPVMASYFGAVQNAMNGSTGITNK